MRDLGTAMTLVMAMLLGTAGCATRPETRSDEATAQEKAPESAAEPVVARGVTPEKMEEIDLFFHQKVRHLQYECYNAEVDKTRRKYEGTVAVSLMVVPGGKASEVKLISSTLRSVDADRVPAQGLVDCVLDNVKEWTWPSVDAPAPYMGSIAFKPAW